MRLLSPPEWTVQWLHFELLVAPYSAQDQPVHLAIESVGDVYRKNENNDDIYGSCDGKSNGKKVTLPTILFSLMF